MVTCKLEFFAFVSSKFEAMLTFFQSDVPLLPFAHDYILDLITSLLSLIYNPSFVDSCKSLSTFATMDLSRDKNLLKKSEIHYGYATNLSVDKLFKEGKIDHNQKKDFQQGCLTFVKTILNKIQKGNIDLNSVALTC